jgi:hypothetical protein
MWQSLMEALPDWPAVRDFVLWVLPDLSRRETFEAIRDLSSVGIGALGALLAYLAIRMGREHARIGKEQTEIATRMEALEIELATIAKRQMDIAEFERRVLEDNLLKRAVLVLSIDFVERSTPWTWKIGLKNIGNKGATGCYWKLFLPKNSRHVVHVFDVNGKSNPPGPDRYTFDNTEFVAFSVLHSEPIYADYEAVCGGITMEPVVERDPGKYFPFPLHWSIHGEDGRFPPERETVAVQLEAPIIMRRTV